MRLVNFWGQQAGDDLEYECSADGYLRESSSGQALEGGETSLLRWVEHG